MASASGVVSSAASSSTTGGTNVSVTVEAPTENQVVEITYDGHEVLQPPLSLAEHLVKQAGKVDFAAVVDGDGLDDDDDEDDDDDDDEVRTIVTLRIKLELYILCIQWNM